MTTRTATSLTTPAPHSFKSSRPRRQQAEAEIQALDARDRAAAAEAEARHAEQQVERRQAQARLAQHRAELDDLDAYLTDMREREQREWSQQYDKRQEMMEQLRRLATEPLPHVPRSLAEHQAELAQLDTYVDHIAQAERDKDRTYIDQCESRRLWDPAFRGRYDLSHPGGIDGCNCTAHRVYRRDDE